MTARTNVNASSPRASPRSRPGSNDARVSSSSPRRSLTRARSIQTTPRRAARPAARNVATRTAATLPLERDSRARFRRRRATLARERERERGDGDARDAWEGGGEGAAVDARAPRGGDMGDGPRKLPKLTFTLKRPVAPVGDASDSARCASDGGALKRSRESEPESEEDRRIRELKRKMARLSELLPDGEVDARTAPTLSGAPRGLQRAVDGGGGKVPSGLARGTAPRAAIFDQMGYGGEERDETPASTSAREAEEVVPELPKVGGQNLTIDPPKMKNEGPVSKKKIEDALNKLQKLDKTHVFAYPVTEDIAPGYFSVISEPMDFTTIRARLKNNEYLSFYPFCVDVEKMYRNALLYNPPSTEIHQLAAMMLERARRMLNKLRGLPINSGFIKPKKVKPPSATPKRPPSTKVSKAAGGASFGPLTTDVDMFATSVDVPSFAPNDVNNFSFDDPHTEEDFDLGLDSLLDDSFPMLDVEGHLADTFDIEEDVTNDTVFVNRPQEMKSKPMMTTKRQSFKVPQRSRNFVRFPMIFMGAESYAERMKNSGNIFLSSSGSATLDMYSASVRAFLSGIDKEVQEERLSEKWKQSAAPPVPRMVPVPRPSTPVPTQPPRTVAALPSTTSQKSLAPPNWENTSLATLLREDPSNPAYPPKVKAGLAGMRAMQRAGEVLRGADVPKDENPLDKLPPGFIPQGRDMKFTVTVLGNTIAHSFRKIGVAVNFGQLQR